MLEGLTQNDFPLTLDHALRRMERVYGDSEVATFDGAGLQRQTFAQTVERVERLASALRKLGVGEGDRVATFAWNNARHFELYMAVPCMGAVLHTLNIRLFPEQLVYIVNHARDRLIFVDASLVPLLAPVAERFERVERYVVMGASGDDVELPGEVLDYEQLLAAEQPGFAWPRLDERSACGLCYTSGTTGNPKGVLYSHRSTLLHALGSAVGEAMGYSSDDRVLPVVPMFHVNAWGIPYTCALVGADLVFPDRHLQAEPLARLIESERVTVTAGVPTIWMDVLRYADERRPDLSSLRMVICGGAAVPLSLMQAFQERHGVRVIQAWGMTEMSPLGSVARPPAGLSDEEHWRLRATQGRIVPLVEARIVDDDGNELPWDGRAVGELEVRGPWIARDYFEDPSGREKFDDGWLRTGDIAAIDERGFIRITDRAKDVIKSGGEWISSVELENHLMAHPAVREAAVIARPDERWSERPLACVVLEEGRSATPAELRAFLADRVAKWWLPDDFAFVAEIPKTSVGKFDKKVLRAQLEGGQLKVERAALEEPQRG
ncbi:long-chain fatty acid--CoA ligase [Thermoleophilum album]|uniref:Fatty-acyl-CoA synthase n=1 Tax=Thermoleophilum album TaxID=29539 RepID=A0A1H6FX02_THEAL|nr:long-chain fatty acid--CoA ligase [Thermoleophilum album]SEH15307.1 fatty-acyl-CoA synthase [Thermoleophilum album]